MEGSERRRYKRLSMEFELSCRKVSPSDQTIHSGQTINVCPGGLYFRTSTAQFKPGHLLKVELSIPPTPGLLELGGRIAGLARVLRTYRPAPAGPLQDTELGVAVQFSRRPRITT
jgi:hypothetical protein